VVAAAAATPGLTALQMLRDLARVGQGRRVLVTGASGGVACLAIGIASRLGISVTAIGSGRGLALARRLGAERVVDRTAADVFAGGPFDAGLAAATAYRPPPWRRALA